LISAIKASAARFTYGVIFRNASAKEGFFERGGKYYSRRAYANPIK
jgi:hypothetical protein